MNKEEIFTKEFRDCCRINIRRMKITPRIYRLGYDVDDFIDLVIAKVWQSNLQSNYKVGTITANAIKWTMSGLDKGTVYEHLETHYSSSHEKDVENRELAYHILNSLNGEDRKVFQARFIECMSLEEVGVKFGYTREWARQLQNRIVRNNKRKFAHYDNA